MEKHIEKLLNDNGWIVECSHGPLEIRNPESESFASNEAAKIIIDSLINEKTFRHFEVNPDQREKLKKWKQTLPGYNENEVGAIGGAYTYCFTATGLGDILVVKRHDGHEVNLTEFEDW